MFRLSPYYFFFLIIDYGIQGVKEGGSISLSIRT